jgi:hypothetical protein
MKRTLAFAFSALFGVPGIAAAQTQTNGRFQSGALTWTPTISLRDAGVDSNVYDEPTNPRRDRSAVLSPQVDGLFRLSAAEVKFAGGADFVYFQRYTQERSVNTRGNARVEFRMMRIRPFGSVAVLDARERVNSEIDVRARRAERDVTAGVGLGLTPRGTLEVRGSFATATFREGEIFRGVDLAQRLNRETTTGSVRLGYEVTPLTKFFVEGSTSRDRFTLAPGYDSKNLTANAGFEFAPDALLQGRATVGFHKLEPLGPLGFGFDGLTAGVDIGYVLVQRTRFDIRIARDTSYSFEAQPYFLRTAYGGEISHTLFNPIDLFVRGAWETLEYPGIVEQELPADTLEVTRFGGGVVIRPGRRINMSINYEISERTADTLPDRRYDRQRLYTNVTYGF